MTETLSLSTIYSDADERLDALRASDVWFPGDKLLQETVSPSPEELRTAFGEWVAPAGTPIVGIEGSLSALTQPAEQPKGYAFIDIDDTVGDLCGSMQMLQRGTPACLAERNNNHDYGDGMFFTNTDTELKTGLFALLRGSEAGITPVANIDDIALTLASWRAEGIYVCFVSSQTPGSELPTVQNFLGRYFNGRCDGIVIPEGHYTVADKGTAAQRVMEMWGYNANTPVLGIDDIPAHTANMRKTLQGLDPAPFVLTMQPAMPSHMTPDYDSLHPDTAAQAFELGSYFFARSLGKRILDTETTIISD